MQLQTFAAQDANGNVQTSPTVYIYTLGTTTPISGLEDENGDPLSNPFTGGADGRIVVAAPTGTYDMRVVKGSFDSTQVVQFIDLADQVAAATTQVGLATTQANNAASSADASAASAAAAAEIVNISEVQTFTNPLQPAPRVAMTGGTSSRGWLVQNNANVDNPTNDFTLTVPGIKLSDYSPSAEIWLYYKYEDANNYWGWKINTAGTMTFIAVAASVTVLNVASTAAIPSARDGDSIKPTIAITRETASAAGSAVFSVDGVQIGTSVAITAAATADISNSGSLYILGTNAIRYASEVLAAIMFNRSMTISEVLSLCINGVDPADVRGSQVPVYESDFSAGVDGFVGTRVTLAGNIDGIGGEDDWLRATSNATNSSHFAERTSTLISGVKYRVTGKYYIPSTNTEVTGLALDGLTIITANNTDATTSFSIEFTTAVDSLRFFAYNGTSTSFAADGDVFYVKDVEVARVGVTLQLSAQDAQSNTGQVFDSSGNSNHALLPASGATVLPRLSGEGKHRGTTVRAATSELQYIGGTNQNVVPADIEIISWRAKATTSATFNLGNGSSATAYGSAVTIGTTWTDVTPTGGAEVVTTALKLTETPTASYTGSVQHQIVYRRLES